MSASEESKESTEPKAMATDEGEEVRIRQKMLQTYSTLFFCLFMIYLHFRKRL